MDYVAVGAVIKSLRKAHNMCQDFLAEGICSRGTLSKVERGEAQIKKDRLDLLLQRLGYRTAQFFPSLLTKEDYEAYELRNAFADADAKNDMAKMESLVAQMEKTAKFKEDLHRQSLLLSKAILHSRNDNANHKRVLEMLDEAIRITIPRFSAKLINVHLLGNEDQEIITIMALTYFEMGEKDRAITMMQKLADNVRKRMVDTREKARSLTYVLYNLSRYLGQTGKYRDALAVCNEAIEAGEQHQMYGNLPKLKYNKAWVLLHLNRNDDEIYGLLHQSYYGALLHGEKHTADAIRKRASDVFKVKLMGN